MKWLRALLIGLLLWVFIFIEISITMIGMHYSSLTSYVIHYVLMIPVGILCAWIYYNNKDKLNGFVLGIVIVLTGIILDMIITIPLFIHSYATYFGSYYLWIGYTEFVVIVGIYNLVKK